MHARRVAALHIMDCAVTAIPPIRGATCKLCGKPIVPDYPADPDAYVHRDTGEMDCSHTPDIHRSGEQRPISE